MGKENGKRKKRVKNVKKDYNTWGEENDDEPTTR
jgi:hypothetical protein